MPSLVRHPHAPAGVITSVEAELERTPDGAIATYRVTGDISRLILPPPADPIHTDGLWQTTCFELFLDLPGNGYREFNFSPSGAWAAYDFDGYRDGSRTAAVTIETRSLKENSRFILVVGIRPEFPEFARVGLTAVIAESDGHTRYWATSFAPGDPDFHADAVRSLILDGVSAE